MCIHMETASAINFEMDYNSAAINVNLQVLEDKQNPTIKGGSPVHLELFSLVSTSVENCHCLKRLA